MKGIRRLILKFFILLLAPHLTEHEMNEIVTARIRPLPPSDALRYLFNIEYTQESFTSEIQAAGLEIVHQEIHWGEIWAEVKQLVSKN